MGLCRLCSLDRKLVRAHAIPEAFWRVMRDGKDIPVLVTNTVGQYSKKSPIGVYDDGILCESCEQKFQLIDDYGITVLLGRFEELFRPVEHGGQVVAFESDRVDQMKLLRFFTAVAWRASVSTQNFYRRVDLGPYEAAAANAIVDPDSPVPPAFGAVLARWRTNGDNDGAANGMLDPTRERLLGAIAYRIYFGRIHAWFRVGGTPFAAPLSEIALGAHATLKIITRDFGHSRDLATMVTVLQASESDRGRHR